MDIRLCQYQLTIKFLKACRCLVYNIMNLLFSQFIMWGGRIQTFKMLIFKQKKKKKIKTITQFLKDLVWPHIFITLEKLQKIANKKERCKIKFFNENILCFYFPIVQRCMSVFSFDGGEYDAIFFATTFDSRRRIRKPTQLNI